MASYSHQIIPSEASPKRTNPEACFGNRAHPPETSTMRRSRTSRTCKRRYTSQSLLREAYARPIRPLTQAQSLEALSCPARSSTRRKPRGSGANRYDSCGAQDRRTVLRLHALGRAQPLGICAGIKAHQYASDTALRARCTARSALPNFAIGPWQRVLNLVFRTCGSAGSGAPAFADQEAERQRASGAVQPDHPGRVFTEIAAEAGDISKGRSGVPAILQCRTAPYGIKP
jgi:hypothetical protein